MKILKLLKRIGGSVAIVLFVIVAAFYISNDEIRLEPARFVKLSNGVTHYELAGSKAAHLDLYARSQENLDQRLGLEDYRTGRIPRRDKPGHEVGFAGIN